MARTSSPRCGTFVPAKQGRRPNGIVDRHPGLAGERETGVPVRYDAILFDLDGTLTDPKVGITRSVQIALARFGIDVADRETLTPYIGPPLIGSFQRLHGLSAGDAVRAVAFYREHFAVTGLFENALYPGIPELLAALRAAGETLVVATSKPTVFAEQIVAHFGLAPLLNLVVGSNLDHTRVDKAEVVAYALGELPGVAPGRAVMVGDREHDVFGARANGVPAIGVAYGYGSVEELRAAGTTAIAESVEALGKLLAAPSSHR